MPEPFDLAAIREYAEELSELATPEPDAERSAALLLRCLDVIEALRAALQGMKDERGGHSQECNIFLSVCTCIEGRINAALARVTGGTDA